MSKMKVTVTTRKNDNKKNLVCVEGGGTRGIFGIGVLKYLFNKNKYVQLQTADIFGGTSVGSYFAAALSLGFDQDDMLGLSKVINLSGLVDNSYYYISTVYRYLRNGYMYYSSGRQNIIMTILNYRFAKIKSDLGLDIKPEQLTVAHLKILIKKYPNTYKDLIINSVDESRGVQVFMTTLNDNFDDVPLLTIMMASSAIPFAFEPTVMYNVPGTEKYYVQQSELTTTNYFVDGGVSTNNPLDYFLINHHAYKNDYNLWLLRFTKDPTYVKIDGTVSMLKQLVEYLIGGKNDVKMDLIHHEYSINCINLKLQCGALQIYDQPQIQQIISEIYTACCDGEIHFNK